MLYRIKVLFFFKKKKKRYAFCYAMVQLLVFGIGRSGAQAYKFTTLTSGIVFEWLFLGVNYIQTGWLIQALTAAQANKISETEMTEQKVPLAVFVSSEDGFELFMEMLVGEFSTGIYNVLVCFYVLYIYICIKLLLCYVECTQFLRKWRNEFKKVVLSKMSSTSSIAQMTQAISKQSNSSNEATVLQRIGTSLVKEMSKAVDNLTLAHSTSMGDTNEPRVHRASSIDDDEKFLGWTMNKDFVNGFPFLPDSTIVHTDLTLYEHVRYLHNRYIRDASQYQVNISSSYHREWNEIVNNKDDCKIDNFDPQQIPALRDTDKETHAVLGLEENQVHSISISSKDSTTRSRKVNYKGALKVLNLVENTRKDLWKLMKDSYLRFRDTPEYKAFVKNLKEKETVKTKKKVQSFGLGLFLNIKCTYQRIKAYKMQITGSFFSFVLTFTH
ncbi:hypothetical protein RFI_17920 [Reticulomyxa filosa]|uniref:RGS domain-containing protein n=1 Tax=Reticulomyxa filosa TaxID=46433 RepID=X6N1X5_RETFI|nr:hypothetical protein RFI_17920 [Reticulomyxa filosa]|eukprot:ETO19312.1 hypothetical protein RFI_17920 [Reticulomyxa filosa]